MSEQIKEFIEMPKQFMKEGSQFINRCRKPDRKGIVFLFEIIREINVFNVFKLLILFCNLKEFIKISQAVAMGFFVMGFICFFVKLIHIPINNILVYV